MAVSNIKHTEILHQCCSVVKLSCGANRLSGVRSLGHKNIFNPKDFHFFVLARSACEGAVVSVPEPLSGSAVECLADHQYHKNWSCSRNVQHWIGAGWFFSIREASPTICRCPWIWVT